MTPPARQANAQTIRWVQRILSPLRAYHRYEVYGMEHVPQTGPALIAVSHSLATYDGFLLGMEIYRERARLMVALGDDLLFRIPGTRELAKALGIAPASPGAGENLLADGHLVGVAPGGMKEALRTHEERYRVAWDERKGFVRLAIRAQVPIILAACPSADDIYEVQPSALTRLAYEFFRVPLPVVKGIGITPLPRPVKLHHQLSEPIMPPEYSEEMSEDALESLVDAHHRQVVRRMAKMMGKEENP